MEFDEDPTADVAAALKEIQAGNTESAASNKPADAPPSEAAPPAPSPEGEPSDGARARDEAGRFAKAQETAAEAAPKPEGVETPKTEAAPAVAPPSHWKGVAKVAWNTLSPEAQKHIAEDYAQVTQAQSRLSALESAIGQERAQVLAANYGSVDQGLKNVLAGADFANKNPQGFILWLAQRAGIDLTQLAGQSDGGWAGAQPSAQPNPLFDEINSLRNELQQLKQQSTQAPIKSQIDAMSKDAAKYPYFNDLRPHMAALIQSGAATTLTDAYDQAAWSRPDIRTSLIEGERKKSAEAEAAKVTAAKQAAISITGSPRGAKAPDDEPNESIEETARRHYRRIVAA